MVIRSLLFCVVALAGCHGSGNAPDSVAGHIEQGRYQEACRSAAATVESGRLPASALVYSPRLVGLKEHSATRNSVRELVRRHATESDVRVVTDTEPGERRTLEILIVDEATNGPRANAEVTIVQVDDPRVPEARPDAPAPAPPLAAVRRAGDGTWHARVAIGMQPTSGRTFHFRPDLPSDDALEAEVRETTEAGLQRP